MSKIILKQVYLLNWYGFIDKTIPVGKNLSLITGENECGKSTVLDAINMHLLGILILIKLLRQPGSVAVEEHCLLIPAV